MSFAAVGISAGVGAVSSIAGAAMSSKAAKRAAELQAQSAREANALQERMYNQSRADQEPWRTAGVSALSGMQDADFSRDFTAADFQQDPGYAFRMQEGQKALERSAAARGGLNSGAAMKALSRYGQDFASNEYSNAYNRFNADRDRRFGRLSNIAGMGQNAASQMGSAGQNYANQSGANTMGAANAAGAAGMASANSWANAINGVSKGVMDGVAMGQQKKWMDKWLATQGGK